MKIAHESPLSVFRTVRNNTDYDYALLHLLADEQYLAMFKESKSMGREIILDNSLFELGDSMSSQKLAEGIESLQPTWFVVPDALNDEELTMQRWEAWEKEYGKKYTGSIGVVQGKTWEGYKACYKFLSDKADKIALTGMLTPFFSGYNQTEFNGRWFGRTHIIRELMREGIWNFDKPHHVLGCTNPIEFSDPIYTLKCFDSVDTSSPVMAAVNNIKYTEVVLIDKPKGKLCDHVHDVLNKEQEELAIYNIKKFRDIVKHTYKE